MPFERWLHVLTMRVRALFRGRALDDDLDEELRWHVEHLVDANIERGMSPAAARRAALVAMGGVQQRKEECREVRGHISGDFSVEGRDVGRATRIDPLVALRHE